MSKMSFRLRSSVDLGNVLEALNNIDYNKNMVIDIYEDNEDKSDKQNRLLHLWYPFLGNVMGLGVDEVTRYCKLHFGVPILRRDDREYCGAYNQAIIGLDYESKLKMMDIWPVTRKPFMKSKQMNEYLTAIDDFAAREHSCQLPHPEDLSWEALGVNR